jgi:hypothetical protein
MLGTCFLLACIVCDILVPKHRHHHTAMIIEQVLTDFSPMICTRVRGPVAKVITIFRDEHVPAFVDIPKCSP